MVDSQTLLPVIFISCHSLCKKCMLVVLKLVCVLACEIRCNYACCTTLNELVNFT